MFDTALVGQRFRGNENAVDFKFWISYACLARFLFAAFVFSSFKLQSLQN